MKLVGAAGRIGLPLATCFWQPTHSGGLYRASSRGPAPYAFTKTA